VQHQQIGGIQRTSRRDQANTAVNCWAVCSIMKGSQLGQTGHRIHSAQDFMISLAIARAINGGTAFPI
jgi:hypothetical protein